MLNADGDRANKVLVSGFNYIKKLSIMGDIRMSRSDVKQSLKIFKDCFMSLLDSHVSLI